MHMKPGLVSVCKQDIVACIPDFLPSFHCSANLISVTLEEELGATHTHGHWCGIASGLNVNSAIIGVLVFQPRLLNFL